MALSIRCPSGHLLRVAEKYAGRKLRCPKCQRITMVPLGEPAEAPAAEPRAVAATAKVPPVAKQATPANRPSVARPSTGPPPLKPSRSPAAKASTPASATNRGAAAPSAAPGPQSSPPARGPAALPDKNVESRPPLEFELPGPKTKHGTTARAQKSTPVVALRKVREKKAAVRKPQVLGYRADVHRRQTVLLLGWGWLLLSMFQAAPAWRFLDVSLAPGWARVVLAIALIELAYAAWMVTVPDWSTVWVAMIVLTVVATLYGAAMAVALFTPRDTPVVLDLDDKRGAAAPWCAAVILLTCLMTYFCGRVGHRWHKVYQAGR